MLWGDLPLQQWSWGDLGVTSRRRQPQTKVNPALHQPAIVTANACLRTSAPAPGSATLAQLPDIGIRGTAHGPFADLYEVRITDLMSTHLQKNGLDPP